MEKLLFLRLTCFFMFMPFIANAQEYAVFKTVGSPNHIEGATQKPITKGALIKTGKVSLTSKDALIMVNDKGEVFEINAPGNYAVPNFGKYRKEKSEESFTSKYFSYVWRQMSQEEKSRTHTGNVYRDALIDILVMPADSVSIFKNEVVFTWEAQQDTDQYYFFLKNQQTKTFSKIKLGGNSITLYPGSNLLEKGSAYSWGVATTEYPDLTRIKMNQLNYLSKDQYESKKEEMATLIADLKAIGFSDTEIEEHLCEYFKLCSR